MTRVAAGNRPARESSSRIVRRIFTFSLGGAFTHPENARTPPSPRRASAARTPSRVSRNVSPVACTPDEEKEAEEMSAASMMSKVRRSLARKLRSPSSRISTGREAGHPPEKPARSPATSRTSSRAGSTTVTDEAPFTAAASTPSVPLSPNWRTLGCSTSRYGRTEGKNPRYAGSARPPPRGTVPRCSPSANSAAWGGISPANRKLNPGALWIPGAKTAR